MCFEVGFETVGNATLIAHDEKPILATDPWIQGSAYFGSWGVSHEIPEEQLRAIRACPFVWISHGHPDHLSGDSMQLLRDKQVLLPDHVGQRVFRDLTEQGFQVRVLEDRKWVELSPRVRVLSIADYNQDGILLVDVNGRLVVNLNDASDHGWGGFVRRVVARYPRSFLLSLTGFGDADMFNLRGEDGDLLPMPPRTPLGQTLSSRAKFWGASAAIPFSAMHRYQRVDSAWASQQSATLADYAVGFDGKAAELLPAFLRYDCLTDQVTPLNPRRIREPPRDPKEFGDDWSETLDRAEEAKLRDYFLSIEHLRQTMAFIRFRVGGREALIELRTRGFDKGLTFEVPRGSLLTTLQYEIFDDLLIGNFMKVTLHGEWGPGRLYPDFSPYVAKYADNGRAKTLEQLRAYHRAYYERDRLGYLRHKFDSGFLLPVQAKASRFLRSRLGAHSSAFRWSKAAYWKVKSVIS
jgi:hypothetical protein